MEKQRGHSFSKEIFKWIYTRLLAIACEGIVTVPNSGDFIKRHSLKAPSSVNTGLKSLQEKELIYKSAEG